MARITGRRVLTTLVAMAAGASWGCGGDSPARVAKPVSAADAPSAFAPLVRLHAREDQFPIDAGRFVDRSTLYALDDECGAVRVASGRVAVRMEVGLVPRLTADRLGMPPGYRTRGLERRCPTIGTYSTLDDVLPFDGPGGGFYLDLLTDSYDGDPRFEQRSDGRSVVGVPTYWRRSTAEVAGRRGMSISYWLLYGRHQGYRRDGERVEFHEGDWERVDVLLERRQSGRYAPSALRVEIEGRPRTVPWDEVDLTAGDHPVVYAALKSHTPYPESGTFRRRASTGDATVQEETAGVCAGCVEIRTWERLERASAQPWYGFGGGWGLAYEARATSGPRGPSPYLRD